MTGYQNSINILVYEDTEKFFPVLAVNLLAYRYIEGYLETDEEAVINRLNSKEIDVFVCDVTMKTDKIIDRLIKLSDSNQEPAIICIAESNVLEKSNRLAEVNQFAFLNADDLDDIDIDAVIHQAAEYKLNVLETGKKDQIEKVDKRLLIMQ